MKMKQKHLTARLITSPSYIITHERWAIGNIAARCAPDVAMDRLKMRSLQHFNFVPLHGPTIQGVYPKNSVR